MLIAGDIGGTKSRLGVYAEDGDPFPEIEKVYASDEYDHLEDIVDAFITETGVTVTRAVFGLPGPVINETVKVTNLPWVVNAAEMQAKLAVESVKLLNDLEATAYGIPFLPPEDLVQLNECQPVTKANKVVIAPGTGLGEALLIYDDGRFIASASEGGHADFAPRTLFQIKLLEYMMGKFEHVSYERVCSGIGIPHIYDYLRENSRFNEDDALSAKIAAAEDPTPLISQAAMNAESALCRETMEEFVSILGGEASNMALNTLAKGGVYLGGGIPPKILPLLQDGSFMSAFLDKGRFSEVLKDIPVYVILNEKTALFGCACYALGW